MGFFVALTAAIAMHVGDDRATAVRDVTQTAPAVQQPVSQQGKIVAVSPTSVTAQSVDGFARTYVINSETNAITESGSLAGGTGASFAVNDEVSIVGIVRDGTAIATAVADKQVSNLDGPPMDAVGIQ
ncbi:hypothetical protein EAH80_06935 [Mycobacterium hodleri]|uniref:DUF5666 domain-containing protein n=1 Tax=Mycolicibacterium hodleri TaxID=49897 RepID=A0A502EDI4_9MYCO|nr:hypothetical protein EAH80_06935 [Mycolicibacterium hodleri]